MECRNLTGATTKHLEPWQKRVTEEQIQLHHRIESLEGFIDKSDGFNKLEVLDQGLLIRQRNIMREYWKVLDQRIARFFA